MECSTCNQMMDDGAALSIMSDRRQPYIKLLHQVLFPLRFSGLTITSLPGVWKGSPSLRVFYSRLSNPSLDFIVVKHKRLSFCSSSLHYVPKVVSPTEQCFQWCQSDPRIIRYILTMINRPILRHRNPSTTHGRQTSTTNQVSVTSLSIQTQSSWSNRRPWINTWGGGASTHHHQLAADSDEVLRKL